VYINKVTTVDAVNHIYYAFYLYILYIYINGINKTIWIINASIWPVPLLDAPAVTAVIMSIGTLLFYTYYLHLIIINIIYVDINDSI